MAPNNAIQGLDHATEQAGPLLGAEPRAVASQALSPFIEQQGQGVKIQKALVAIWGSSARPFVVGGALGSPLLYLLSKLPEGVLWGPIDVPDVGLGPFVTLGSFAGSFVIGGVVKLAALIAPTPHHYWGLFEVWSKYRLGRISPEQYYEYGAVLDYQRLYGQMPPDSRPEAQADFVHRVVQWRKAKKRGRKRIHRRRGAKALGP